MTTRDTAIHAFIDALPTAHRQYAARYAHWLADPTQWEVARDHAEAAKQGISSRDRLTIRRSLLKIVTGRDWAANTGI